MKTKLISLILALLMCFALLPNATAEQTAEPDNSQQTEVDGSTEASEHADAAVTVDEGTKSFSTGYPNTYVNTGKQSVDIAGVAKTQVGYQETADNHTKYNYWYYGSDTSAGWCAIFVSWCANQAGIPTSIVPKTASPGTLKKCGTFYSAGTGVPQPGDLVIFSSGGSVSHVGLVVGYSGTTVTLIHGNWSQKVSKSTFTWKSGASLAGQTILGVTRPNYQDVKTVTVTFNGNGGTASQSTKTVFVGGTYGDLPSATLTGYGCTGWYTSSSGGSKVTADTTVTNSANHTLYARWSPRTYTVLLDANGGSVSPTSINVTYNGTYSNLPTPTRTGYDFAGWYTDPNGGSRVTTSTTVTTAGVHTLYARWTAKTYTVTLNAGGGSVSPSSITVTYGGTYSNLPTPTRSGYTFSGWYTASGDSGTYISNNTTVTTAGNHTLYAHWTGNGVIVWFNSNGGNESDSIKIVYNGETYGTLPTVTRTGYHFDGWFTAATGGSQVYSWTTVSTTSGHTLYAHWTANTYTLYIHINSATSDSVYTATVTYDSPYGDAVSLHPAQIHASLEGWFTEPEGGTEVTPETIVKTAGDHNVYAHWTYHIAAIGRLDEKDRANTKGLCTFDFYMNGEKVADDKTFFRQDYELDETGTYETYEIKDIRVCDGVSFTGFYNSARCGTLNGGYILKLAFTTVQPEEWLSENTPEQHTIGGHTYLFFSEPVTWYEAKTISEYLGGHLLEIDDSDENEYVNGITDQAECWVGAMDETYNEELFRNFIWIGDGMQLDVYDSYSNWASGQPGNDTDNDEGASNFVYMKSNGKWATAPGCAKHGFVCEIDGTEIPVAFDGTVEWNADDVQFKGATAYVVANGEEQTPRFTVKTADGTVVDPENYDYEYEENTAAGTGYLFIVFKKAYKGTAQASFKIYLPATTATTVENTADGIKLTWEPVEGAAGYVIYRRAWSSTTNGWTAFARWDNTTETTYLDGHDDSHKVYAGTRYQYGVKAYFARRTDPVTGAEIGGNVNDPSGNFNLGLVGPLKTTVRITTRELKSVTAGTKQMTVKWGTSSIFTGYQLQYATNKSFTKNLKTIKITNPKTAQRVIKSLTTGTTYYVRIRSYHEFEGMTYYGGWSNVLSCTVE